MVISGCCCAPAPGPGARGGRETARGTMQFFRLTFKVLCAGNGEGADTVLRHPSFPAMLGSAPPRVRAAPLFNCKRDMSPLFLSKGEEAV